MNAVIGFFEGIGTAIVGAFDFLVSLVGDIVYLVQLTGKILGQLPTYFSWLPAPVLAVVLIALTIAVVYQILGR